jgi:predicted membrane-bound dolichyl-phosphate-mannose-protein mannosyltransferase
MTQHAQVSVLTLVGGIVLMLGGVFGIYYQGWFWASGVVAALNSDEDALALGLPAGVSLAGALLVSYVILDSPLTAHWRPRERAIVFTLFSLSALLACGVAAWLAGQVAASKLHTTERPSNKSAHPTAGNVLL